MKRMLVLCALVVFVFPELAHAVPVFSRKNKLACSACHTAWPKLNAFGRDFKLNGYQIVPGMTPDAVEPSSNLTLESDLPLALVAKLRPVDKKRAKPARIRAVHELSLFLAATSKKFSAWAEIAGEDEQDFNVGVEEFEVGYHHSKELNLFLTKRPLFMIDPFQDISNMGLLTVAKRSVFGQGHASGEAVGKAKQSIVLNGRFGSQSQVYYALGVGTDSLATDPEGEGRKDFSARIAYTLPFGLTVGSFLDTGAQANSSSSGTGPLENLGFTRTGFDLHYEVEKFTLQGTFLFSRDDIHSADGGGSESNSGFYIEGIFPLFRRSDGLPGLVPLVRLDRFQNNDGKNATTSLTFQLANYFRENVKGFVEFQTDTNVPAGMTKNNRLVVQFEAGF